MYQESDNFDDNALAWFKNFKGLHAGTPLYDKGLATVPDLVKAFGDDIAGGKLPQVSWIVAPAALSEHADHRPADGMNLTAQLLAKLAANPGVWAKTVFLLNYDEGGGFFDHVPPPMPPTSAGDGLSTVVTTGELSGGKPIGLGFRVPMIVVSPFSRGRFVCSEVFDHTSVLRFCEKVFGVAEPNISAWRKSVTDDLFSAFDFTAANTAWPALPDTSTYPADAAKQCGTLPDPKIPSPQVVPTQEAGTRQGATVAVRLRGDRVGDREPVPDRLGQHGLPRRLCLCLCERVPHGRPGRYTVEAGKTLSDHWAAARPTGTYDLSLYGPNGFHRRFKGNRATATAVGVANPEVKARADVASGRLYLTMTNTGSAACAFTVKANAYRADGPWTYELAAGATVEDFFTISAADW